MSEAAEGYFARKAAFNAAQGYRIDYKYLGMAYAIEIAVVTTSLLSAWFFAKLYGHGDATTMAMMMLAPIAYAGVEIARVPLALALRTQPNWFWKVVFAVMVLCAVAVSVKSLSQLGEVMFRPRLIDVTHATADLKDAQSRAASYAAKVAAADAVVAQRASELTAADTRLKAVNSELGALPADRCAKVWHTTRDGRRYSAQECHADARQKVMSGNLADAQQGRAAASDKLDAARKVRDALDPTAAAKLVSDLELKRRDAILNSQLHSFTGMFFGVDPTEVTEGQLHAFLRFFVFFPAIFAALAATALALASVTPLRRDPEPVEIDGADVVAHVLAPYLEAADAKLARSADEAVARSLAARHLEPRGPDGPGEAVKAAPEPAIDPAPAPPASDDQTKTSDDQKKEPGEQRPVGPMRPTLVSSLPPSGAA